MCIHYLTPLPPPGSHYRRLKVGNWHYSETVGILTIEFKVATQDEVLPRHASPHSQGTPRAPLGHPQDPPRHPRAAFDPRPWTQTYQKLIYSRSRFVRASIDSRVRRGTGGPRTVQVWCGSKFGGWSGDLIISPWRKRHGYQSSGWLGPSGRRCCYVKGHCTVLASMLPPSPFGSTWRLGLGTAAHRSFGCCIGRRAVSCGWSPRLLPRPPSLLRKPSRYVSARALQRSTSSEKCAKAKRLKHHDSGFTLPAASVDSCQTTEAETPTPRKCSLLYPECFEWCSTCQQGFNEPWQFPWGVS